jgi:hypothetical protein
MSNLSAASQGNPGAAVTFADEIVILLHGSLPDDSPLKNPLFRV